MTDTYPKTWAERTADEKIIFLQSERRDCIRLMKKQIHTRGVGGYAKRIDQIDKQLRELQPQAAR